MNSRILEPSVKHKNDPGPVTPQLHTQRDLGKEHPSLSLFLVTCLGYPLEPGKAWSSRGSWCLSGPLLCTACLCVPAGCGSLSLEPDLCPAPCLLDPIPTAALSHASQKLVTMAAALEEARSQMPPPLGLSAVSGAGYASSNASPGVYGERVSPQPLSVTPGLSLVVLSPDSLPLVRTWL